MADLERIHVRLIGCGGASRDGIFQYDDANAHCALTLQFGDEQVAAVEADYFESLCAIRIRLDERGLRPLCYGASRNVFPSGMARDMGAGLKAYKLTLGQHGRTRDLVGIFDVGPDTDPASVEEQKCFYDE